MTPQPSPEVRPAGAVQFDTPRVMRAVRKTRNWVTFIAVLMLLGVSAWLFMIVVPFLVGGLFGIAESIVVASLAFVFIGMTVIPAILMLRFASRSNEFLRTGSPHAMVNLLVAQRWIWTLLGIYAIVYIVMMVATILIMLVAFSFG